MFNAAATILFVDSNSTNSAPPYSDWSTAAQTIQDAVDFASPGDEILVTNGVYQNGGRIVYGSLTNRVVVDKAVTVQSVNGPAVTVIRGYPAIGDSAVRCVYVGDGATLSGFTLTNGATLDSVTYPDSTYGQLSGGGAWCEFPSGVVTNCIISGNAAKYEGGGIVGGAVYNCILEGNSGGYAGGGAGSGTTLNGCLISGNGGAGFAGGGLYNCVATNCLITNNNSTWQGGGAYSSTLENCDLESNVGGDGGGANACTLNRCYIRSNSALIGGGVCGGALNDCVVVGNLTDLYDNGAYGFGGGAQGATLINCTVVGNSAAGAGGGTEGCTLTNCIVFYNSAAVQDQNSSDVVAEDHCCTEPTSDTGFDNITKKPKFIDDAGGNFRLSKTSPCINSGINSAVVDTCDLDDLDGNPRIAGGTVDIGAYEYQTPRSLISYAWLRQYGLPTDGSEDFVDLDGTGMNDYQKWIAGLNPTNAASVLVMFMPASDTNSGGVAVSWQSVSDRNYNLERGTNLNAQPAFSVIQSNIPGSLSGTNCYLDTSALGQGPYFYRVCVQQ